MGLGIPYLADAVDAHVVRAQRAGRTVQHRGAPVGDYRVVHVAAEQLAGIIWGI